MLSLQVNILTNRGLGHCLWKVKNKAIWFSKVLSEILDAISMEKVTTTVFTWLNSEMTHRQHDFLKVCKSKEFSNTVSPTVLTWWPCGMQQKKAVLKSCVNSTACSPPQVSLLSGSLSIELCTLHPLTSPFGNIHYLTTMTTWGLGVFPLFAVTELMDSFRNEKIPLTHKFQGLGYSSVVKHLSKFAIV